MKKSGIYNSELAKAVSKMGHGDIILIGDVARAGIYTSLIRQQTPLSELDFDKLKEHPQLLAFGPKTRAEKLGGVPR